MKTWGFLSLPGQSLAIHMWSYDIDDMVVPLQPSVKIEGNLYLESNT